MRTAITEGAARLLIVALVAGHAGLYGSTPAAHAESGLIRLDDTRSAPPADSGQLDRLVKDLGLSLLRGPLGDSLAVPLAGAGLLRPYASIGGGAGLSLNDPLDPYRDLSRFGSSTGMGAGFSWKLGDRLELFGEYRFLSITPGPDSQDSDDRLQGGFSIRF